jgi:hypothetical protein
MPAEFIDLSTFRNLKSVIAKSGVTSDHFHTWVHGDYPGTDKPVWKRAFNRCMKFTLVMTVKLGHLAASGSLLLQPHL